MDVDDTRLSSQEIEDVARRIDRPIVLVGMMGVGKSSVGKRLAAMLQCPFIDADDEIEKSAQMSIPEIFATFGEQHFRHGGRTVIATGGGAFCNPDTRALILQKGIAVWLDSDVDTLVERTARKTHRPLLNQGDPREVLTRLRDERRPAYSLAPIHVMSGNGPHGKTVTRVLKGVGQWL